MRTENNATTNSSTGNAVLDFFSKGGAMRGDDGVIALFKNAYEENPLMALKALFWLRDVRQGQGERDIFRKCIREVPVKSIEKNLHNISELGRWDDLFALPVDVYIDYVGNQLNEDIQGVENNEPISLLGKWMPSENTSSKETRALARQIMSALDMKSSAYRKMLSKLRRHIKVLETQMSEGRWDQIDYEKIPSQAHRRYIRAFKRHDAERYNNFVGAVEKGEKKVNTASLAAHEIINLIERDPKEAQILWDNLPDYTNGNNALVMADVSASMKGIPMQVSISLAMYFAQRNKGAFHGAFMTFSAMPEIVYAKGSLKEMWDTVRGAYWDLNTNVAAAFDAILKSAVDNNANQEDIPSSLIIISDMQFDQATSRSGQPSLSETALENAKRSFQTLGYELPHVIFWNVRGSNGFPAKMFDDKVTLISGSSQTAFKYAVEGLNPIKSMNAVLNSERYSSVVV